MHITRVRIRLLERVEWSSGPVNVAAGSARTVRVNRDSHGTLEHWVSAVQGSALGLTTVSPFTSAALAFE